MDSDFICDLLQVERLEVLYAVQQKVPLARHYLGKQAYEVEKIGTADDLPDADGVAILN